MSPPQNDVIHRRLSPSLASLNVTATTTTTMDIGSSSVENCGFIIESSTTTGGDVVGNQEGGHDHHHHVHHHHKSSNNVGICRTSITILLWYTISNTAILSTKWLFNNHFSYPLTVTTYSNFTSFIWSALLTVVFPNLRPIRPPSKHEIVHYIIPIGFFTALEIGCSNLALELLTVSFGTILKGSAPIFTFGFGLLIGVESFTVQIFGSLMLIAIGIILASLGEGHEFQLFGFILQLTGTALGGLRWAMTHKILQQDGDDRDGDQPMSPLTATLYTAPMTAICVLPFAIGLEGTDVIKSNDFSIFVWLIMTGIATLVFLLLMSEYWLVKVTSSLALSVAGVFKELLTIGGGIFFFSDTIDWLNVIGFLMCQIGIVFYVCLRYEKSNNNNDGEGNYSSLSNNNNTTTTTTTTTINGTEDQSEQQDMFRDEEEEEITTLSSSSSSKEKENEEEEGIELPSTKHHYKDNNNNFTINDDDDDDDIDIDDTGILT